MLHSDHLYSDAVLASTTDGTTFRGTSGQHCLLHHPRPLERPRLCPFLPRQALPLLDSAVVPERFHPDQKRRELLPVILLCEFTDLDEAVGVQTQGLKFLSRLPSAALPSDQSGPILDFEAERVTLDLLDLLTESYVRNSARRSNLSI